MKRVTLIATALVLAVFAMLAGGVAAQQTNASERTFLTFSNTVQMPGVTLPAGTYVFKLADTGSRNVVQVWNEDEDNMLGQWLFVQAERPEVTEENVVMFKEMPAGTTPAVQYWYFPGEKVGKEFLYPREQAIQIAKATGSRVLTGEGSEVSSVDAEGNVTAWEKEQQARAEASASASREGVIEGDSTLRDAPASAQPSAAAGSLAGNRGADTQSGDVIADVDTRDDTSARSESAQQPAGTSARAESQVARADELPRTASPLALMGVMGLLSLAGAMGLRAFRQ